MMNQNHDREHCKSTGNIECHICHPVKMSSKEYRRHVQRVGQKQMPAHLVNEIKTLVDIFFPVSGAINSSTNINLYNTILSIAMDAQTEMLKEIIAIDEARRIKAEKNNHLYSSVTKQDILEYAKAKRITLSDRQ